MFFKISQILLKTPVLESSLIKKHLLDFLLKKQQFIEKGRQRRRFSVKFSNFLRTPVAASEERITEKIWKVYELNYKGKLDWLKRCTENFL